MVIRTFMTDRHAIGWYNQRMTDLAKIPCVPCRGGEPAVSAAEMAVFLPQIPDWTLSEQNGVPCLQRQFKFDNFAQALAFTNQVGALAEAEDHHPAILTEWGRVTVTWWTHVLSGLHRNDFILAARTDALFLGEKSSISSK